MNTQKPEKAITSLSNSYQIHSIFQTIQGEGPFTGTPCVFVRLAGCNLQCPQCDTDYTEGRQEMHPSDIVHLVMQLSKKDNYGRALVVITGGEPFRQPIGGLIRRLLEQGCYVQVETNGTLAPPQSVSYNHNTAQRKGCYIVCSPKSGRIHAAIETYMCAVKYVGCAKSLSPETGLPLKALEHTAKPHLYAVPKNLAQRPVVYLQPVDEKDDELNRRNMLACVQACLKFGYTLQLQTHKIIGVE